MQMEIRAAAIRGIDRLIDDLGGDGAALLSEFGVSPADLESEHGLLPTATAGRILRSATKKLNCPDFGLRLAAYQDMSMLGPLALAVGNCDTVGEGLDCASRFLYVHNQGIRLSRARDPEHYAGVGAVEYRMLHPDIPYEPQTIDAGLGLLHRNLITMSGGYELLGVHMPHPPLTDESVYTEFFGAPVRFDTGRALLRVPTKLFAQPMSTPVNPELRRMVVGYLETHYTDPRENVVTTVRSAVSRALGTVPARIDLVAEWLYLHPRTLQRRLAQEGTSFQAIVDDVRKNAAHRLLTGTDMPFSQVASLVELAGQAALTRAARRWFGRTPTQVRRAARDVKDAGDARNVGGVGGVGGVGDASTAPRVVQS
ncbi:AraC family transcriptional regulator ligand-binding domain-containing protein [Streptomyces sp. NPDC012510]|uniref:AraC family transcriptional regulator n=1 Tax=Streptomyces sp. NPDC012510 TaxID=3364838 RepID=UPI0036F17A59